MAYRLRVDVGGTLINSFANGDLEERIREIAREIMPDIPISISSEILQGIQEYD